MNNGIFYFTMLELFSDVFPIEPKVGDSKTGDRFELDRQNCFDYWSILIISDGWYGIRHG